jgi:hypothetical protein
MLLPSTTSITKTLQVSKSNDQCLIIFQRIELKDAKCCLRTCQTKILSTLLITKSLPFWGSTRKWEEDGSCSMSCTLSISHTISASLTRRSRIILPNKFRKSVRTSIFTMTQLRGCWKEEMRPIRILLLFKKTPFKWEYWKMRALLKFWESLKSKRGNLMSKTVKKINWEKGLSLCRLISDRWKWLLKSKSKSKSDLKE